MIISDNTTREDLILEFLVSPAEILHAILTEKLHKSPELRQVMVDLGNPVLAFAYLEYLHKAFDRELIDIVYRNKEISKYLRKEYR